MVADVCAAACARPGHRFSTLGRISSAPSLITLAGMSHFSDDIPTSSSRGASRASSRGSSRGQQKPPTTNLSQIFSSAPYKHDELRSTSRDWHQWNIHMATALHSQKALKAPVRAEEALTDPRVWRGRTKGDLAQYHEQVRMSLGRHVGIRS